MRNGSSENCPLASSEVEYEGSGNLGKYIEYS
jgi:hypothetical protein